MSLQGSDRSLPIARKKKPALLIRVVDDTPALSWMHCFASQVLNQRPESVENKDILDRSAKDVNHSIFGGRELKLEDLAQSASEFEDKVAEIGMRSFIKLSFLCSELFTLSYPVLL